MTSNSKFPEIHADDTACLSRRVDLTLSRDPSQEGFSPTVSIKNLTADRGEETIGIELSTLGGNLTPSTRFRVWRGTRITFEDSDTVVHVPLSNIGGVEGRWAIWDSTRVRSYDPSPSEVERMSRRLKMAEDLHSYPTSLMTLPVPSPGPGSDGPSTETMAYVKLKRTALVPLYSR